MPYKLTITQKPTYLHAVVTGTSRTDRDRMGNGAGCGFGFGYAVAAGNQLAPSSNCAPVTGA